MPGITLRKDGRYTIRKMQNGVRKEFYTRSYEKAKKILKQFENNKILFDEDKENLKYKNITIKEWVTEWLEIYKKNKIKEKTFKEIKNYFKQVYEKIGHVKLKELKSLTLQKFLNELKHNRTKERIELYLDSAFKKAVDLDIINKNPFNAVEKEKKNKYKNDCYNFNEQQIIIKNIKNSGIEHEIMIYLMTGCRPNELPKKENFNFENNIIEIYGTKTDKSQHRQVEMSKEFANYMKTFFENNEIQSYNKIKKSFKDICLKNNIQKPIIYRLRHTFATNHFILGTPAKIVADWMGHTSIKITLDTYTDIDKTITKEKILNLYNNFYYIKN